METEKNTVTAGDKGNPLAGKTRGQIYRQLFFSILYLSTFTFGGGYVIVTLLKEKFVDELHWIDEEEMLDLVAIASPRRAPSP